MLVFSQGRAPYNPINLPVKDKAKNKEGKFTPQLAPPPEEPLDPPEVGLPELPPDPEPPDPEPPDPEPPDPEPPEPEPPEPEPPEPPG